jgi:hypothetical protein
MRWWSRPTQLRPAFASLGDTRDYVLAPGGSFKGKDLDGWQVLKANSTSRSFTPTVENPVFHPVGSFTPESKAWQASADMPVFPERGGAHLACAGSRFASPPSQSTVTPASGVLTTSMSTPDGGSERPPPVLT